MIEVTVTDHWAQVLDQIRAAANDGLETAAEGLLTEANRTVPHEEGVLEGSGEVSTAELVAQVGYHGPYAVVQHEDMELRHDPGRRAKWLQLTFQERAQLAFAAVARVMAGRLR